MNDEKGRIEPVYAAMLGFIAMLVTGVAMIIPNLDLSFEVIMIALAIETIVMMGGFIGMGLQNQNDKKRLIKNRDNFQQEYDVYADQLGVVKSNTGAALIETGEYGMKKEIPQYLWIADGFLRIFPKPDYYKFNCISSTRKFDVLELQMKSIHVDSILYFEEIGEVRKFTMVSGGGYSKTDARRGNFWGGEVGAVIASRVPIESKVMTEDDRQIELLYKDSSGNVQNLVFDHDSYNVLKKLIASKELRRIIGLNKVQDTGKTEDTKQPANTKEKLKELNDMKSEGLITEEEYAEQKSKILESFAKD